ncbi:MAG: hypothetical protein WCW33_02720 [Candidatus Babeliales bacterium]|jgi:hypothetical protein
MQKIAVVFLSFLTLLSSTIQPMGKPEPGALSAGNSVKNEFFFVWHQPFVELFTLVNIESTCSDGGKLYVFKFCGTTKDSRCKRDHPILGKFTLTVDLAPRSKSLVFVEARLHADGVVQTVSGQEPIGIDIPPFKATYCSRSGSDLTLFVLDDTIAQLIDVALFFERGLSQWACSQCSRPLWCERGEACKTLVVDTHYITKFGSLWCWKCSRKPAYSCEAIHVDALEVPRVFSTRITNKLVHAQQYGGVW